MFDGDLVKLTLESFQHLVFALTMRVLGPGASTFCPGPDAGATAGTRSPTEMFARASLRRGVCHGYAVA